MAQTTDGQNACAVVVQVDNAAGALTDISGSATEASLDFSSNSGRTFTFDGDFPITKICKSEVSMSLNVVWSLNDAEGSNLLEDWKINSPTAARTVSVSIPNNAGGSIIYSGEWVLENLSIPLSASSAEVIVISASLLNDGTITRASVAGS